MSDHEAGELDDWEDASLPGGFTSSFKGTGHESLNHDIITKPLDGSTSPQVRNGYQPRPRPSYQVREKYRPIIQSIPGVAYRTTGIQSRKAPLSETRPIAPNGAYIKYRSDAPADAHYELSMIWRVFVSNMRRVQDQTLEETARARLDEISQKTDAFVGTPKPEETKVPIWGTQEQVDAAMAGLKSFELDVRTVGVRPGQGAWYKGKAFDGRVESRQEEEEREKAMAEGLRILEQDVDYDLEAIFLWPDEVDINKFIAQHDTTTFNDIRGMIMCKIDFVPDGIKYVRISANTESHLMNIYMRLVNLVKEEIAQSGSFVISNRFRLPRAAMYRNKVGLHKDPETNVYLPTLHGDPLPAGEADDWRKLCLSEDAKNRNIISSAIELSLKSLHASQKHVRMRVTFAELGFSQLKLPKEGEDYSLDDFCSVVVDERIKMQPLGVRISRGDPADLVDILSSMEQFGEPETRYVLHFDFDGRNNHTLRLESEFRAVFASDEMEMYASRWLEFGKMEDTEILEVNLLDFEHLRTNAQIHIGATKILSPGVKGFQSEWNSFESKVMFKGSPHGLKAPPRRRAAYPPGRQDLARAEEITIARFRFKQGDGYFELQRKDIYDERRKTATPVRSLWDARFYYPEWDNIMGQFASLKPGEEVPWSRSLSTFFVDPKATHDLRALPKGFKTFMDEVGEISALLNDALERLPEFEMKGANGSLMY